jgi:CubicO group peptidase (beta-lactamase class C family)
MFRITRAERSSIRTAVASFYKEAMQNLFKLLPVALALGAIISSSPRLLAQPEQPTPDELRAKISQDLPAWLKQYNVPSASVAYIANGRLAWTVVAGEQSPGVPATDKTLYNIASLTKPIVAETILRLASQNKLQLDESIYPYWVDPDIKNNPWNKLLTPRLCLSHQTGFANWRRMTNGILTFKFQPGTQSSYSGEGYFYVARFAQNKAGQAFDRLAQDYVLGPLGMEDTSFTTQDWFNGRLAQPNTVDGFVPPLLTSTWNAADLVETTVTDYAHFVAGVMRNEGLSPAIAAQRLVMTRDWTTEDARKQVCAHETLGTPCHISAGMGLGWQIIIHNGITIVDHSGSDAGVNTFAFFIPSKHVGAVIFTNGENGSKVIGEILRVLYPDPVYAETVSH